MSDQHMCIEVVAQKMNGLNFSGDLFPSKPELLLPDFLLFALKTSLK